jgi:Peptidase family M28
VPAARTTPGGSGRRTAPIAGLVALALLLGLTAWSVVALQPPAPAPAGAPAGSFSAERAFAHVQEIADEVHVAGSPANAEVADHLERQLTELGLDTRAQNAVGTYQASSGATEMARVRNVVGVLPGSEPTGRLFLVAHYDSVETGPGAADDASGVSSILETTRALSTGEPLRNDVVVVFTDAEEACLCGAEAFTSRHPLATDGGVVLNVEARGTGGPPVMFETSAGNADLARAFAVAAPHPVASSFAVEVYRALPNDTDFSVFLDDGRFTGLNSAFIDGSAAYHAPEDTPDRLDLGSVQASGDNLLAVVRELGAADLGPLQEPAERDATYFPVLDGLVRYPGSLVWPLAVASLAAVGVLVLVARARWVSSLPRTLGGAVLALVPLVLAPLAVQALWLGLVRLRPGYSSMLDPWRPGWFRVAAVALVVTVVLLWFVLLRRRLGGWSLIIGSLVWFAVLAAVLAHFAPGGSYLAALPAIAGAVAGVLTVLTASAVLRAVLAVLSGAVAVVVLAPTVALFFPALGLATGAAPSFVATLLALALLPAVELVLGAEGRGGAALVPASAALVTAVALVLALAVDGFDPRHPVPSQLVYALDADSGQAWWVSTENDPGEYTGRYVDRQGELPVDFPYLRGELALGDAEAADLTPPEVEVLGELESGGGRQVTVRITPQRDVRLLAFELVADGATVTGARVEGRDVAEEALGDDRLFITFHAPPEDGVEAVLTVDGDGPLRLRAMDGSDGLDGLPGFLPRPPDVSAAGTHSSDLVVVSETVPLD